MADFHFLAEGDRVRVRDYDDMASEYGSDLDGFVRPEDLPAVFNPNMKKWCGEWGTIQETPRAHRLSISFDDDSLNDSRWAFYDWMVEGIEDEGDEDLAELPDASSLYTI